MPPPPNLPLTVVDTDEKEGSQGRRVWGVVGKWGVGADTKVRHRGARIFRNFQRQRISEISEPAGPGGELWASRAGPAALRELGPGRPFMDLLPKSSNNLQKPRFFLPRTRNLLIFIEIY